MPLIAGTSLIAPTFTRTTSQEAEKMTWLTSNTIAGFTSTTPSKVSATAVIWDDTENYVDWQLASVKTAANDKAVAAFDKYTDGYAMAIEVSIDKTLCANTVSCGFCLEADAAGASCVVYMSDGTTLTAGTNMWIPSTNFGTNGVTMTVARAAAIASPATNTYKVDPDDTNGFNGNWSCSVTASSAFIIKCGRYMPKSTTTNTYTKDFRFAPKMEVGGTNKSPPAYNIHIYRGDNANLISDIREAVTLKNATALAVSATLALAAATLY